MSFSPSSYNVQSSKSSVVWRPLLPNLQCIQVLFTEVLSVLDLYTFDVTSPGGSRLSEDYTILPNDCTNRSRVREGGIKTITLVDEHLKQLYNPTFAYIEYLGCSARNGCHKDKCNWKGRISIPQDKPLNLCNIEYHGNHNPDHIWKKPYRMSSSIRKTIMNRVANTTPSILATGECRKKNRA
ncbi:17822_t:CDS:2 [Dentiscutata erythropus]|uniref:17822_t:CDS:1 n=1 Tax=Dentiscutata erythropus TaxID=1348616 RepID=A0A9N9A1B8_9GLOM|nr:17822_t:CDS:2 [Dentiscutata erythropus]